MRHSKTERIIAISASICLLLVLGCGMLGLAVQQRVIAPKDINVQLGSLIIIARGPDSRNCPPQDTTTTNLCDLTKSLAARPDIYRMWVFWYTPGRGTESTRTIVQWTIPVRQ